MAFQLILHKLTTLERAMQAMPPLLKKIVDQLEAQTTQPEVEVATYAQLYPELPGEAEDQPGAKQDAPTTVPAPRRWWRWFLREVG
jgi:hypothetical protein